MKTFFNSDIRNHINQDFLRSFNLSIYIDITNTSDFEHSIEQDNL